MSLEELTVAFLDYLDEHAILRDRLLTLEIGLSRGYDDLVERITEQTLLWPQYCEILEFLQLRRFDPAGDMDREELLDIYRLELMDLIEDQPTGDVDDDETIDSTDCDWSSVLPPLLPPRDNRRRRSWHVNRPEQSPEGSPRQRDDSPERQRDDSPERQRDDSPERPVVQNLMQRLQQQRQTELRNVRPKCVREAALVALKFLGDGTCEEIAQFIRKHRLWGGVRCMTTHVSSMMWQDRFTIRGYRVYERRLFTHPSLHDFDTHYNVAKRMKTWSYALSSLGEDLYEEEVRPRNH